MENFPFNISFAILHEKPRAGASHFLTWRHSILECRNFITANNSIPVSNLIFLRSRLKNRSAVTDNPGAALSCYARHVCLGITMRLSFESANVNRVLRRLGLLGLWLCCLTLNSHAQSRDINAPTLVTGNEVSGRIDPRDLGDARLTAHFYAVTGVPGDLLITVEGRNLNGDVDVFTVSGLRPLLKYSLYAETFDPVTKSLYLRKREDMIIRVEARTPNDDPGNYRLRFGGAFEPITSGPLFDAAQAARVEPSVSEPITGTGRRVTSAGARIEEPPEVAAAPTPEPTPEPTPAQVSPTEPPVEEARPVTRTPRGRRVPGRRTRTRPPDEQPAAVETEAKPATDSENVSEAEAAPARPATSTRRGAARRRVTPPVVQEPEVESGPRLVIETNDGTLIDRYMSGVRRVTVENGRVVVIGKDGSIHRIPLANVVRMVIAP